MGIDVPRDYYFGLPRGVSGVTSVRNDMRLK